jgi:hypothetical protein
MVRLLEGVFWPPLISQYIVWILFLQCMPRIIWVMIILRMKAHWQKLEIGSGLQLSSPYLSSQPLHASITKKSWPLAPSPHAKVSKTIRVNPLVYSLCGEFSYSRWARTLCWLHDAPLIKEWVTHLAKTTYWLILGVYYFLFGIGILFCLWFISWGD